MVERLFPARLFVAVVPDDELRAKIVRASKELPLGAMLPVRPSHVHLTLRFIGEVHRASVAPIAAAIGGAVAAHRAFSIEVEGGGTFGDHVAWAGVVDTGALAALAADIDAALEGLAPPRDRPFHPHITLARSRGAMPKDIEALKRMPSLGPLRIEEAVLFEGLMTSLGPNYEVVSSAKLVDAGHFG